MRLYAFHLVQPSSLVAHANIFIVISVSLKAKLSPSELFTLIMDVRRRVETDSTGSKLGARQVVQHSIQKVV